MSDENEVVEDTGPKMAKKVEGITEEAKLKVLAETNPKREGSASFDRFECYFTLDKKKATVADALAAGLTMGDIRYDFIHGSIEVDGATVVEYEVTPRGEKAEGEGEDAVAAEGGEAEASGF